MNRCRTYTRLASVLLVSFVGTVGTAPAASAQDAALMARARAIHNKAIKLDTHVDIEPSYMYETPPNYRTGHPHQVDLVKMRNGGMNGIFFSIFVGQGDLTPEGYQRAYDTDTAKFNAVHH